MLSPLPRVTPSDPWCCPWWWLAPSCWVCFSTGRSAAAVRSAAAPVSSPGGLLSAGPATPVPTWSRAPSLGNRRGSAARRARTPGRWSSSISEGPASQTAWCSVSTATGEREGQQSGLTVGWVFRCGKKFVGDTARTLDKRMQVWHVVLIHSLQSPSYFRSCWTRSVGRRSSSSSASTSAGQTTTGRTWGCWYWRPAPPSSAGTESPPSRGGWRSSVQRILAVTNGELRESVCFLLKFFLLFRTVKFDEISVKITIALVRSSIVTEWRYRVSNRKLIDVWISYFQLKRLTHTIANWNQSIKCSIQS